MFHLSVVTSTVRSMLGYSIYEGISGHKNLFISDLVRGGKSTMLVPPYTQKIDGVGVSWLLGGSAITVCERVSSHTGWSRGHRSGMS